MAARAFGIRAWLRGLFSSGIGIPNRALLGYALWTVGAFLFFWILTFPHEIVAQRITSEIAARSGWRIEYDSFAFRPWAGYRFTGVSARRGTAGAPVEAARIAVRPGLRDLLLRARTTLLLDGDAYGGGFRALVADDGGFELELDEISLAAIPTLRQIIDGRWQGRVSGKMRIHSRGDVTSASGEGSLALADGALTEASASGFKIPDVRFSRGELEFSLAGGKLEIGRGTFEGPDLDVNVRGQVQLRAPAERSPLDLALEIHPVPGSNAGLEPLLQLWNRNQRPPDGRYRIGVGGTLGAPRLR